MTVFSNLNIILAKTMNIEKIKIKHNYNKTDGISRQEFFTTEINMFITLSHDYPPPHDVRDLKDVSVYKKLIKKIESLSFEDKELFMIEAANYNIQYLITFMLSYLI